MFIMNSVELIEARESDWQEIAIMMADFYHIDRYPFDKNKKLGYFMKFNGNPILGKFWRVIFNAELAGYVILTLGFSFEHGRDAFIDELYLKPQFRRRGIGSIILDLARV